MGGGGGDSQAWAVKGSDLTDIQDAQPPLPSSSSSRPGLYPGGGFFRNLFGVRGGFDEGSEKSNVSLEMPAFLRAILVVRLENMVGLRARWTTRDGGGAMIITVMHNRG